MVFEALQNKERKRNTLVSKSFTFYYSILCFPFVISRLHSLLLLLCGIEGALIKAGIDPYIGILHRDDYNRPVLVYDVIEMYRIWVDYVVYTLLAQNVITEEFYSVREDGSYWLEALGRRVLIQSLNDYMDEIITMKGVTRSRLTHLSFYVQSLAQQFKNTK